MIAFHFIFPNRPFPVNGIFYPIMDSFLDCPLTTAIRQLVPLPSQTFNSCGCSSGSAGTWAASRAAALVRT